MIDSLRFFELYTAIGLHTKNGSSYDFFKYGGKTRVSSDKFMIRKDKYFFEKWAKKLDNEQEAIGFIVSNKLQGNNYIIKYTLNNYTAWKSYKDAVSYRFEQDFLANKGIDLAQKFFSGSLNGLEYIMLLDYATNGIVQKVYNQKYGSDNILWNNFKENILLTYSPFVVYYFDYDKSLKQKLFQIIQNNK